MLFDLRPNSGGGDEDNRDLLQKVPCRHCLTQCPRPCSRPMPTYASARDSWPLTGSLGQSLVWSPLLSPGSSAHRVLFVPSQCLFPQSCVSSGGSMVGLMVTSSKRAYAIPRSTAPRAPALQQSTADPFLLKRHSNTVLSQSLWNLWVLVCTRYV